jgi:uncharacterized damage-inducible protein DinB
MDKRDLRTLYDYNYWANARVLQGAAAVTPEQFVAPGPVSHGSLRGALVHALGVEWLWRLRCQEGVSPSALPAAEEFPTAAGLAARWQAEEAAMRAFLDGLTDADVARPVTYRTTRGEPHTDPLWALLVHVVNHGTQFRAEAALLLTAYGHSPGDLDLIRFLREPA